MKPDISAENHPGKVVGVYQQESTARRTAQLLIEEGVIANNELDIISPNDRHYEKKLEPETKAIGRTLLASHLMFGLIGLVIGLLVATSLIVTGIQFAASSPVMLLIATGTLGTFMGLLVAGAVSLRPDHDSVVNDARYGKNHNQWSVVVHTKSSQQIKQAKKLMESNAVRISESF